MRSETANRILSETTEETKQKVRETANRLVMENKLISMVDFVLEQFKELLSWKISEQIYILRVTEYANFLKQPLKLGMFVPCDENDVPLVEPENYDLWCKYGDFTQYGKSLTDICRPYQQAKDHVLFEGFELVESYENWFTVEIASDDFSEQLTVSKQETIEDLLTYSFNPEFYLTASAIKQF